jgi:hypothetical protein
MQMRRVYYMSIQTLLAFLSSQFNICILCLTLLTLPCGGIADAARSGVASEAAQTAREAVAKAGQMSLQEAQLILGVEPAASWKDVVKVREPV